MLLIFLQQKQPKIMINQRVLTVNIEVERNQENQKHKEEIKKRSEGNRIKDVRDHLIPKLENETKAEQSEILDLVLNQNLFKKIQTSKGQ